MSQLQHLDQEIENLQARIENREDMGLDVSYHRMQVSRLEMQRDNMLGGMRRHG